jgi:murein tripeptide amidase MpaA
MSIIVSAAFDSGAIRVVDIRDDMVSLEIPNDHLSDFYQWFHFRVAGARGRTLTFRIINCAGSAYPLGWPNYRTRVSTDRAAWVVAPDTHYADGVLTWTHDFTTELAWFAYFQPYAMDRHDALIATAALADGVTHRELGQTLDGRAIDCLTLGTGAKQVWLYARQHPGEPMAEWWMEGAIQMLTDPANPTARTLREQATIHIVPNMNPDGSFRGHLRTNAAGINLNREWDTPSLDKSPEVLCVRNAMDERGVDVAMDIHGDEAIPANFLAGFEGIPSWTDALGEKFYDFGRRLAARTPDFQTERGYGKAARGTANLSMSTNQLAERFGAVAMTLEMPFKDHDPNPDALHGWDGPRSKRLAVACLETLADMIDTI